MKSMVLSSAKEEYKSFIRNRFVPLFFRDTYLDMVCDGNWDAILVRENDKVVATYVFMLKRKFGIKYIVQPQLCPYNGPLFFGKQNAIHSFNRIIEAMPQHHLCIQEFFFDVPDLTECDNVSRKKHTYLIDAQSNIEELWNRQSSTHRRIIRKAERELHYETVEDMDVFLSFVEKTFSQRNKHNPNDPDLFRKVDRELQKKGQRKIVRCINDKNQIVAMCYFMNDEKWTYNFANSVIQDYRHYGMNLILWNEIKSSLASGRSFDFEGSMLPGVDKFFKRFQGDKTQYQSRNYSKNRIIDLLVKLKT